MNSLRKYINIKGTFRQMCFVSIVNQVFHSVEEVSLLNIFKDLYLLLATAFVLGMPFSSAEPGYIGEMFTATLLWVGPLTVFWTPFVEEKISFKRLSDSRSMKYRWGLYIMVFLLPIMGSFLFLILFMAYYSNHQPIEELLDINRADESVQDFNTVKEYKRTCNECGETWRSLVGREKELEKSINQEGARYRENSDSVKSELERLKKCPACASRNYDEEIIEHEKSSS